MLFFFPLPSNLNIRFFYNLVSCETTRHQDNVYYVFIWSSDFFSLFNFEQKVFIDKMTYLSERVYWWLIGELELLFQKKNFSSKGTVNEDGPAAKKKVKVNNLEFVQTNYTLLTTLVILRELKL